VLGVVALLVSKGFGFVGVSTACCFCCAGWDDSLGSGCCCCSIGASVLGLLFFLAGAIALRNANAISRLRYADRQYIIGQLCVNKSDVPSTCRPVLARHQPSVSQRTSSLVLKASFCGDRFSACSGNARLPKPKLQPRFRVSVLGNFGKLRCEDSITVLIEEERWRHLIRLRACQSR